MDIPKRKNRSRYHPKKTTGILKYTVQDATGFCEPLSRYGELTTDLLGDFYNLANGNKRESRKYRERLKRLIHESEGLMEGRKLLYRPDFQYRFGTNTKTIYRKTLGTATCCYQFHVYDDLSVSWSNTTQIAHYEKGVETELHDQELRVIAASLELEVRWAGHPFATHIDILKNASDAAKANARRYALAFPIPELAHRFPGGHVERLDNTFVRPDYMCGVGSRDDRWIFYTLEHDRSNEVMLPTKNLKRQSGLRKVLGYSAISKGEHPIYETYMGINNLMHLFVFPSRVREEDFHAVVNEYAKYPRQYLTAVVPPFDPVLTTKLARNLYTVPWNR